MKPVWGLINQHDRSQFEVHLFAETAASAIKHGYRGHPSDCFHDISGLSNEAAAALIERSGIDLLVDLNGYSAQPRLALVALKPAPVIAGWFNMYATSGMASYDYLIGDDQVIPPDEEEFYCEKILRVPGSLPDIRCRLSCAACGGAALAGKWRYYIWLSGDTT